MSDKESPLVSVIVPVYNVEKYIRDCLESIKGQTYKNIEVLMVNDGSKDNSQSICEEFEKQDERFKLYNKKNGGLSDARNYGLDRMNGEYVCFVDGDDVIGSLFIQKMVRPFLTWADCCISNCRYERCSCISCKDNISKKKIEKISPEEFLYNTMLQHDQTQFSVSACTKMYSANVFRHLKFPYGVLYEDFGIFDEVLSKCEYVALVEDQLYYYRVTDNSITNSAFNKKRLILLDYCEKLEEKYSHNKRILKAVKVMEFTRCCELLSLILKTNTKEFNKICSLLWMKINKSRGYVVFARKVRFKVRITAVMSFFGKNLFFWSIREMRKENNV